MIVGILLIQAVAFAILSGIVASNKNRDAFGWGILGFLFGLFGFIAAVAVGEVEEEEEQSASRGKSTPSGGGQFNPDEHEKKCPMCAEYIKLEARRCMHCGHEMSEEEVEQQIEERQREVVEESGSEPESSVQEILNSHDFSGISNTCRDCGVSKAYARNNEYVCPEG